MQLKYRVAFVPNFINVNGKYCARSSTEVFLRPNGQGVSVSSTRKYLVCQVMRAEVKETGKQVLLVLLCPLPSACS